MKYKCSITILYIQSRNCNDPVTSSSVALIKMNFNFKWTFIHLKISCLPVYSLTALWAAQHWEAEWGANWISVEWSPDQEQRG